MGLGKVILVFHRNILCSTFAPIITNTSTWDFAISQLKAIISGIVTRLVLEAMHAP